MAKRWEGEVGARPNAHRVAIGHHLTFPLLRNGPLPLPHFVAERKVIS